MRVKPEFSSNDTLDTELQRHAFGRCVHPDHAVEHLDGYVEVGDQPGAKAGAFTSPPLLWDRGLEPQMNPEATHFHGSVRESHTHRNHSVNTQGRDDGHKLPPCLG